jgi:phosphatidyl-myo-inositol dimannoside synthase
MTKNGVLNWWSIEMKKDSADDNLPSHSENRGLNLLLLTDSFLPHAGGSRVYYYNLYKRLTEQFPDRVTILTKRVPGWKEFDARVGSRSLRIVRRFRPLPNWKYHQLPKLIPPLWGSWRLARTEKIDLIHAGDLFPQGLVAMWQKQMTGLPYLAYCHGEEITQTDLRKYQPAVRNSIYANADGVIAANEFARTNLLRIGIAEEKIFKVLPGVDQEQFFPSGPRPGLVAKHGLEGKKVILSVGRLVARKGHAGVLRALANIRDQAPPFHYLIAGDGPEKQAILSLAAQLGLSQQVTLAGKVEGDQLADYYNLCDVFALVNRVVDGDLEGFGMVFVEANATGKPVLGGRSGGTAEAVLHGQTGFLVNPESPEDIAHHLLILLQSNELRRRMGAAGLERVRTEFNWNTRARAFHEISLEMVMKSRGSFDARP